MSEALPEQTSEVGSAPRRNEILRPNQIFDPVARALRLVGFGHTIAGAARLTGASRQQIYRAREALRKVVEHGPESD